MQRTVGNQAVQRMIATADERGGAPLHNPETILALQRTVGNQVVQRMIGTGAIQRETLGPEEDEEPEGLEEPVGETLMGEPLGESLLSEEQPEGPVGETLMGEPLGESLLGEEEPEGPVGETLMGEPLGESPLGEEQPEGPVGETLMGEPLGESLLGEEQPEGPVGETLMGEPLGESLLGEEQPEGPVGETLMGEPLGEAPLGEQLEEPEGPVGETLMGEPLGLEEPEVQLKRNTIQRSVVQRNFLTDWGSGVGDRIKKGNRWYKRSLPAPLRVLPPLSRGLQGLGHGGFEGGRLGVKAATGIWDKLGTRDSWNNANDQTKGWGERIGSGFKWLGSGALGLLGGLAVGIPGAVVGAGAGAVGGAGRGTYSSLRGVGAAMGSQAGNVGRIFGMQFGNYSNSSGQSWPNTDPSKFTNDEVTKSTAWAPFAVAGTGMNTATFLKGGIDVVTGGQEHYKAKKAGKGASRELAWKKIKGGLKNLGTGGLGVAGGVMGSIASIGGALKSGASAVTTSTAAVPIASLVTGGIDFARNTWSMIRASHKARKIGETSRSLKDLITTRGRDRANLVPLMGQQQVGLQDPVAALDQQYQHDITDATAVRDVAKYARKRKIRKALGSSIGMAGAGLGIAGVAALLAGAAGPVGWGLIGAGAAIGLGYGLYKLIKGGIKRYKRIKRMRHELKTAGVGNADLRSSHGKWHQFFFGGRVKRMKEKGERKILADVQANDPAAAFLNNVNRNDLRTTAKANLNDPTMAKYRQFLDANKTTKQKEAEKLIEQLGKPNSAAYPYAVKLGRQLGVLTKKHRTGEIRIRRGLFSGDRVQGDVLADILNDPADKEALVGLFTRKFGAGL